ncbi:hypothetical protein THRCLA_22955, partial [Thraustotheca clavata]
DDPTDEPSDDPTDEPSDDPTDEPSDDPTDEPSDDPTDEPSDYPTDEPSDDPTDEPSDDPTDEPSNDPTDEPSDDPTDQPSDDPTDDPTDEPTTEPTSSPTNSPTEAPTDAPTSYPTSEPTEEPTEVPTSEPTENPTTPPSESTTHSPKTHRPKKTTAPPTTAAPTTTATPTTEAPAPTTTTPTTNVPAPPTTSTPTVKPTSTPSPATPTSSPGKLCSTPKVTVSSIDVGTAINYNEDEAALKLIAISAKPSGGSYVAFHGNDGKAHVVSLDASDKVISGSNVAINVHDLADIHADDKGFVVLGTRDAQGGGTLNCGNPANLCGTAPSPAVPCYDMYLIRYENGAEKWATKLTSSSASLPPYSTSGSGPDAYMIWWYAHHGRIAYDGTNWASYFGAAISTSQGGCINIHQGDRMKIVSPTGAIVDSSNSFDWGCSHSGYERVVYDNRSKEFTGICKTDNNNRIKFPTSDTTIYPVNLAASNLGDIVLDQGSNGYWMTVSNGQSQNARVHLMHFNENKATDKDILLGGTKPNERACHLAAIGQGGLLAIWEGSSSGDDLYEGASRQMYIQVRSATDGAQVSDVVPVNGVKGNRYQAFREFPDGTVAYVAPGSSSTQLNVLRVSPC